MLVLVFHVGARRFGLDALDVLEIVPSVALQPAPAAPEWVAGLLRHRAGVIPVVDLARRTAGRPSVPLLSTRIVVLRRGDGALLGLLAEGVTEALRIDGAMPRAAGDKDAAGCGPLTLEGGEPLLLVRWTDLVPAELHAAVFAGARP